MAEEYQICWIKQAVEIGTTLTMSWFRGHPKEFGELTPGAFREEYLGFFMKESREAEYAEHFKRQAPGILDKSPDSMNHLEWLFLMQHHGMPTRLLDWTQNILVALYFAVKYNQDEDAELWAMLPQQLNQVSVRHNGIELPSSKYVQYLAGVPFHNNPDQLALELELQEEIKTPISFYPPMRFQRMINQQSVFTIHPGPKLGMSIPQALDDPKHLVKYNIAAGCKKRLLDDLHAIGITESVLFPDLDSLSATIKREMNVEGYSPPDPPKFKV